MSEVIGKVAEVFASGGMAGLLLLYAVLQTWLNNSDRKASREALKDRDELIENMVEKLGAVSDKQAESNLRMAIALSRIESRLGIEEVP